MMRAPPTLSYHALTFRLLGEEPELSPRAVTAIERCEERCGVKLPAALREWCALKGARGRLTAFERERVCTRLTTLLDKFATQMGEAVDGKVTVTNAWSGRPEKRYPWCIFVNCSSSGYLAAVVFDGSDDPPIQDHATTTPFSEYVRNWLWQARREENSYWVRVGSRFRKRLPAELGPAHLDFLSERYESLPMQVKRLRLGPIGDQEPAVDWYVYRFFGPGVRLEIDSVGDPVPSVRSAEWRVVADTEEQLFATVALLWPCHGIPVEFGSPDSEGCADPAMLTRFRERHPGIVPTEPEPGTSTEQDR
jgi:hypothetical protein